MKPKRYRALHITPGVVDYPDENPPETVLIKKQALDKMNPSFLGKPVFNFVHKPEINPEDAFDFTNEEIEKHADGVVSNVGYDVETGYYFVDMMIWDEGTQRNLNNGYGVSNAYIPERDNRGGDHNSVPYNVEVVDGEYHHMAVVENPRYGDVRIFENSKKRKRMFKIFRKKVLEDMKKNADPPPDDKDKDKKKDEEMEMNADSVLVDEEGSEYPVSELLEAWKSNMEEEGDEKATLNMDDEIDVDGKKVSVKDLYDNYCAKKNAEPPTDTALEDVVDPALKKNAADGGKEKPNEHFKKLKINAAKGAEPVKIKVNTQKNRIERGKRLYGSKPVQVEGGN